jgi:hypothetical protein
MVKGMKYEYYLNFWGQVKDTTILKDELGIEGTDFWFDTEEELDEFEAMLEGVCEDHGVTIAFAQHEGVDVRLRTVAKMVLVHPNGNKYPLEYDFGFGYPVASAKQMFNTGNYCCDCNLSLFLSEEHPEVLELSCGHSIIIKDFKVVRV